MALIHDFRDDPEGFLAQYVVIVPMQEQEKSAPIKPRSFEMVKQHDSSHVVELRFRLLPSEKNSIKAYWLPWHNDMAVTLTLGTDAAFMFTTEMTNCRFSVLAGGGEPTRVAHVAGTGSSETRDGLEATAKFTESGERKMRRMSVSGTQLHGYWGQRGGFLDSRSAFVYGQFKNDQWVFKSQVVKGNVTGDSIKQGLIPQRLEERGLYTI